MSPTEEGRARQCEPFGRRLAAALGERGRLCVGIDPHPELMRAWGVRCDSTGLEWFASHAVDALAEHVSVLKPQSAFFEAYGVAGLAVLERVIQRARHAGPLVVLDVKRGDIGSTMGAYADAYLRDGAPLAADAITVSPYLGFGSLTPALDAARATGRGVFVLARTSNPDSTRAQNAVLPDGSTIAQSIVDDVAAHNVGAQPVGEIGVVVGATVEPGQLRLDGLNGPILAPGFGAQGGTAADLRTAFGPQLRWVLPASSRDVLAAGPDPVRLRDAVRRAQDEIPD